MNSSPSFRADKQPKQPASGERPRLVPTVVATSFESAQQRPNFVDDDFFQDLKQATEPWLPELDHSPNINLRLRIYNYLYSEPISSLRPGSSLLVKAGPDQNWRISQKKQTVWQLKLKALEQSDSWSQLRQYKERSTVFPIASTGIESHRRRYRYSQPLITSCLRASHNQAGLDYGIELNPVVDQQLLNFQRIMVEADRAGIIASAACLNRQQEADQYLGLVEDHRQDPSSLPPLDIDCPRQQTSGIMLATTAADKDRLLDLVLDRYRHQPQAFDGQPVSRLASAVAPGIALTNDFEQVCRPRYHVVRLIEQAIRNCSPADPRQIDNINSSDFITAFNQLAQQAGLDLNNLAFKR